MADQEGLSMIRFHCLRSIAWLALAGFAVVGMSRSLSAAGGAWKFDVYFDDGPGTQAGTFMLCPGERIQHLGRLAEGSSITVTITPVPGGELFTGTIVLKNALDDSLTLDYAAYRFETNPMGGRGTFTITSGTGKFADAKGNGTIIRALGSNNGTLLDGRISY
jgi:hypothetical protein